MSDSQQSITVLEELFRKLETATSETREGISSELSSFLNGNIIEHDVPEVFFDEFQKLSRVNKRRSTRWVRWLT